MNREDISTEQSGPRWFIDLDWFPQNNRSFSVMVWDRLCATCGDRLKAGPGEAAAGDLLAAVRDCCAKTPGFISGELPILESIFRLFLANGNQPLDIEQLSQQLREQRGGDSYRTSPEILSRLLENDRYYGLQQLNGGEAGTISS